MFNATRPSGTRLRGHATHLILLLVLALVLGACSSGSTTEDPSASATDASPTEASDPPVDEDAPERIISLSPTATEVLFAIGAGDRVVAVDDQSDFPEGVPTTDLSGFTPNIEAIAVFEPDLVIAQYDPGDLEAGLDELDIEVLFQPPANTLDEAWQQILDLGAAAGSTAAAETLVADLDAQAEAILAAAPQVDLTYYHEIDPTFYTLTSATFVGAVYSSFGLTSIAESADSPYPQLSQEAIIEADPDIIFLADAECCAESAATVAARPGWDGMGAVASGAIIELDEDIASRWGPRVIEFMEVIAAELARLAA